MWGFFRRRSGTPYDDVFKTMLVKGSRLVIPLINEMFHLKEPISMDEDVKLESNEHFFNLEGGEQAKRESDSSIEIGGRHYHVECMCYDDGTIVVRIFEYAVQIAMEHSTYSDNHLTLELPNSGVLYLRKTEKTPEKLVISIRLPEGDEMSYDVPVMALSDYSLEDIISKKLYFLMPFYMFNLEKSMYNRDRDGNRKAIRTFESLITEINDLYEAGSINANEYYLIHDMLRKVTGSLSRKNLKLWKEMDETMGGHVLRLAIDKYVDYGVRKGIKQGRQEGRQEGRKEGMQEERYDGAIRTYNNCLDRGMSEKDAIAISEISDSALKKAREGRNK